MLPRQLRGLAVLARDPSSLGQRSEVAGGSQQNRARGAGRCRDPEVVLRNGSTAGINTSFEIGCASPDVVPSDAASPGFACAGASRRPEVHSGSQRQPACRSNGLVRSPRAQSRPRPRLRRMPTLSQLRHRVGSGRTRPPGCFPTAGAPRRRILLLVQSVGRDAYPSTPIQRSRQRCAAGSAGTRGCGGRTGFPSAANTSGVGAAMRINTSEISDMSIRMNERESTARLATGAGTRTRVPPAPISPDDAVSDLRPAP
jgi:hypothetical protein